LKNGNLRIRVDVGMYSNKAAYISQDKLALYNMHGLDTRPKPYGHVV
jgi:hypothetical protein